MSKPIDEINNPLLDIPITRSKFLGYFALLLSAAGLGNARAHSTLPPLQEAPEAQAYAENSRGRKWQARSYRQNGKLSDRFSNALLYTQDNRPVHFYDDLVRDRTVIIDFMWATCDDNCPLKTANLVRLHRLLGRRLGQDLLMLSISLEGRRDTPAALTQYMNRYGGAKPGWLYLTGDYDEVDDIRRSLGVYDLDPVIDADRDSHAGIITFGNDSSNRWAALPALMDTRGIARTISRFTRNPSILAT